jgi:hypothetical protein
MCYTCGGHQRNFGPLRKITDAEPYKGYSGAIVGYWELLECGHRGDSHTGLYDRTWREAFEQGQRYRERHGPKRRRCRACWVPIRKAEEEEAAERRAREAARHREIDRERRRNPSPRDHLRVVR